MPPGKTLQLGCVIEGNPAVTLVRIGLQKSPLGSTKAGRFLNDCKHPSPSELVPLGIVRTRTLADIEVRNLDPNLIRYFACCWSRWGGLLTTAEIGSDPRCQITKPCIEPVAWTAFICKPAVNRQHHLIGFRLVIQSRFLVPKPEQFPLTIPLADIGAELNQGFVHCGIHRIRLRHIAGTLDGDGSLVIGGTGRAPATVLLFHAEGNPTVLADAVVTACLPGRTGETAADALAGELTHYAMWRDAVNAVGSLPRMVRAKFGIGYQGTIRVSHIIHPHFPSGHGAALKRS